MSVASREPAFGPFSRVSASELARLVGERVSASPSLVLIDGRSGSGKSTLAATLAQHRGAAVVATDDICWHLHPTDWAEEMLTGVLDPWRRGDDVAFRPPGWVRQGREGRVSVGAGADLIIEGVGAARRELAPLADLVVWVRSDAAEARRRGIERDIRQGRSREEAEAFWDEWMSAENPFLETERPWSRADLVVDGTAGGGVEVSVAWPAPRGTAS